MLVKQWYFFLALLVFLVASAAGCGETRRDVILATTTSTVDSGLIDVLVPEFEKQTGYNVKTISAGTGQALEMGKRGEADVLLVHAPVAEKELIDSGVGINYQLVMHNDFIIVGPADDPAGVKEMKDSAGALRKIARKGSTFISRGDDSGTHKKELSLWNEAGVAPSGSWYQESGAGMGQTLQIASEKRGYTLTDRATYLSHRQDLKLAVLLENDAPLLNIYHVMQVNPERFERVNGAGGKAFVDFLVSSQAQQMIGDFGTEKFGQSLFVPDAGKKMEEL